jgi:chloride channel 3/4/5
LLTGHHIPFLDFIAYFTFSTTMAIFAFLLVRIYAPYAAGSGLPEIKTILGGLKL